VQGEDCKAVLRRFLSDEVISKYGIELIGSFSGNMSGVLVSVASDRLWSDKRAAISSKNIWMSSSEEEMDEKKLIAQSDEIGWNNIEDLIIIRKTQSEHMEKWKSFSPLFLYSDDDCSYCNNTRYINFGFITAGPCPKCRPKN